MPKSANEPPDTRTQHGRLRWSRLHWDPQSSMRGAAREFGWNENNYKSHELGVRGKRGIPVEEAIKYARAFGVNAGWLLTGQGGAFKNVPDPNAPPPLSEEEMTLARKLLSALKG